MWRDSNKSVSDNLRGRKKNPSDVSEGQNKKQKL
ncbi:MAG: hypothetical protein ACI8VT_002160 [Saprospiraceae bacterium]|jgi:hypothetical protein